MQNKKLEKRIAALEEQVQKQQGVFDRFEANLSESLEFFNDIKNDPLFEMMAKK